MKVQLAGTYHRAECGLVTMITCGWRVRDENKVVVRLWTVMRDANQGSWRIVAIVKRRRADDRVVKDA